MDRSVYDCNGLRFIELHFRYEEITPKQACNRKTFKRKKNKKPKENNTEPIRNKRKAEIEINSVCVYPKPNGMDETHAKLELASRKSLPQAHKHSRTISFERRRLFTIH